MRIARPQLCGRPRQPPCLLEIRCQQRGSASMHTAFRFAVALSSAACCWSTCAAVQSRRSAAGTPRLMEGPPAHPAAAATESILRQRQTHGWHEEPQGIKEMKMLKQSILLKRSALVSYRHFIIGRLQLDWIIPHYHYDFYYIDTW